MNIWSKSLTNVFKLLYTISPDLMSSMLTASVKQFVLSNAHILHKLENTCFYCCLDHVVLYLMINTQLLLFVNVQRVHIYLKAMQAVFPLTTLKMI
jgi:hypothetical protein